MTCQHCHFLPRRLRAIHLLLAAFLALIPCLLVSAQTTEIATNTPWVPLPELLKKWDAVPAAQVQQEAERGNPLAQHYLGYCYMEGYHTVRDPEMGALWYRQALTNGYVPSASNLGLAYQRGWLGSNHLDRAVYYYTYAAERGFPQAQVNLGILYRDGIGLQPDASEALKWFRLAAEKGHPTAMVEIGRSYRFGLGVDTDLTEAERWFQKAAAQGDALAQVNLGFLYEDEGRQPEAVQFYQRAADQGRSDAMVQLYMCYWDGNGVAQDHAAALRWLAKAAEVGNPYAECEMGFRCEFPEWQGEGANRYLPPPDLVDAFKWYSQSADQNWAAGQYHLGLLYLQGKAVDLDEERGLELVRAAADQGMKDAMHELADLYAQGIGEPRNERDGPVALLQRAGQWDSLLDRYEHGLGVERDLVAAAHCYCRAAMSGLDGYMLDDKMEFKPRNLVLATSLISAPDGHAEIKKPAYMSDGGASDDVLEVLSVYLKAAKGSGQSAMQIGNMYRTGQNAPRNPALAWAWFTIASRNGIADANSQISEIESHLTADELKAAQNQLSALTEELSGVAAFIHNPPEGINPP